MHDKVGIFDQKYCAKMIDDKYYKELRESDWDTYRDLNLIFNDDYAIENGFDSENALLVDSDPKKVQLFLSNAICSVEYSREDANGQPREFKGEMTLLD